MDFEDQIRELLRQGEELRQKSRARRRIVTVWVISAILLIVTAMFAALVK
jgi:type VI protein secretion system component VasF